MPFDAEADELDADRDFLGDTDEEDFLGLLKEDEEDDDDD